jgi:hypothetical protein
VALPGRPLGEIAERQAELEEFIAAMTPEGGKARSNGHARPAPNGQPVRISPAMDDAQVLAAARTGRYGAAVTPLYDRGEWGGDRAWAKDHTDSGKDHFLISEFCYWSQDGAQIERLMRQSALCRPKYDEYHHGPSNPPYLEDLIFSCLGKKERHFGDGVTAAAPSPNGHNGHHNAGEATTPPPSPEPTGSASGRAAAAWEQLARNVHLSAPERCVLPVLIGLAGYQMGQELPARAPIGYITPQMRAASGVCTRYFETALPRLVDLGVLTRTRHPSEANPGRRWYRYSLIGSRLNGQLQTLGQDRLRRRRVTAKTRPPVARARPEAVPGELEALRAENAELRAWKQRHEHHERCWVCNQPLSGQDHVHTRCRPADG